MPRHLIALIFTLSAAFAASPLCAQNGKFDILIGGKLAGHDSFTLNPSGKGFKLTSRFSFSYMTTNPPSTTPFKVSVDRTDEFKYDSNLVYLEGQSEDMEEHHLTGFTPNKPRSEMVVTYKYQGQADSEPQLIGPNLVVLTSFDPGAAQAALKFLVAAGLPSVSVYNGGQGGAGAPQPEGPAHGQGQKHATSAPPDNPIVTDEAKWTKGEDMSGSLDGKPVTVRVFTLAAAKNKWTFFADDTNNLLELSVTKPPLTYLRAGFRPNPNPAP